MPFTPTPRSALALTGLWLQWGGAKAGSSDSPTPAPGLRPGEEIDWKDWPPPPSMGNCDPKLVQGQGKDPTQVLFDFDCKTWPLVCQEPFECQKVTCDWVQQRAPVDAHWSPDGKHDLRLFCLSEAPRYGEYLQKCVGPNADMVAAGKMQYQHTHEYRHGPYTMEIDASFCHTLALCDVDEITPQSTLEDADKYCNKTYGTRWHTVDFNLFKWAMDFKDPINGFTNRSNAELWAMFGCAMGNLHCDIIMCKETYCKDPKYMKKYGPLLERERRDNAKARSEL